jgi:hypothetical protein
MGRKRSGKRPATPDLDFEAMEVPTHPGLTLVRLDRSRGHAHGPQIRANLKRDRSGRGPVLSWCCHWWPSQAIYLRKLPGPPRVSRFLEGTSEIQRMIIGRAVTGLDVR